MGVGQRRETHQSLAEATVNRVQGPDWASEGRAPEALFSSLFLSTLREGLSTHFQFSQLSTKALSIVINTLV